jgi:hypothetical protein
MVKHSAHQKLKVMTQIGEINMKVTKHSENMSIEASGDQVKEVFRELAILEEVFGHNQCRKCNGTSLRFVVRNVDENDFYELRCNNNNCRAVLRFGANKKGGGLFPKIKGDDDKYLPDGGWLKWNKEKQINE